MSVIRDDEIVNAESVLLQALKPGFSNYPTLTLHIKNKLTAGQFIVRLGTGVVSDFNGMQIEEMLRFPFVCVNVGFFRHVITISTGELCLWMPKTGLIKPQ